jgi:hypothetical protein
VLPAAMASTPSSPLTCTGVGLLVQLETTWGSPGSAVFSHLASLALEALPLPSSPSWL